MPFGKTQCSLLAVLHIYFINVFVAKLGTAATGKFLSGKRITWLPKKLLNL
jgi:hypothetical protein